MYLKCKAMFQKEPTCKACSEPPNHGTDDTTQSKRTFEQQIQRTHPTRNCTEGTREQQTNARKHTKHKRTTHTRTTRKKARGRKHAVRMQFDERTKVGYFAVTFTEQHKDCLTSRLGLSALRAMQEEGSPVYNPRCAQAFAVKPKEPPTPKPKEPATPKPKTKAAPSGPPPTSTPPKAAPTGPPQKKPKVEPNPSSDGGDDSDGWDFSDDDDEMS